MTNWHRDIHLEKHGVHPALNEAFIRRSRLNRHPRFEETTEEREALDVITIPNYKTQQDRINTSASKLVELTRAAHGHKVAVWVLSIILATSVCINGILINRINSEGSLGERQDGIEEKGIAVLPIGDLEKQMQTVPILEGADSPTAPSPVADPLETTSGTYHITHYGATGNEVARGGTTDFWTDYARANGYDGFCAVSPDTLWYDRVRDNPPVVLRVNGHGTFLVVDRTASRIRNCIDIFGLNRNRGSEYATATEVSHD